MGVERAKLRRYPRTRREWAREVDGIERFLARLGEWKRAGSEKWVERMGEYYRGRLAYLRERGAPQRRSREPKHARTTPGPRRAPR